VLTLAANLDIFQYLQQNHQKKATNLPPFYNNIKQIIPSFHPSLLDLGVAGHYITSHRPLQATSCPFSPKQLTLLFSGC
jgi:hypothetical protein